MLTNEHQQDASGASEMNIPPLAITIMRVLVRALSDFLLWFRFVSASPAPNLGLSLIIQNLYQVYKKNGYE